jgi:prepilin-type N-terminal cleavage/methylation domain-containing protein
VKKEMNKRLSGFTIVEVLVVIGIIAVLTVVIFPAISEIRAKNRDAEKVSDIAAIQLALSLYYSQKGEYPVTLDSDILTPKFLTQESLLTPGGEEYFYVPLKLAGDKCTYYHLGAELELPSAQIDTADNFSSKKNPSTSKTISGGYGYCGSEDGIDGTDNKIYDVRP